MQLKRLLSLACVSVLLTLFTVAFRSSAQDGSRARSILEAARRLADGERKWNDRTQELKLRIVDRRGGERSRELLIKVKKYDNDRTRSIVFFSAPEDVRGVGMLQWADPKGKDEQWLYLPELGKTRQISGAAKRESFVGTDFSYEDLAVITQILDWEDTEARAEYLREETLDGAACHVLEFTPTGKEISYAKVRAWVDAKELIVRKYEMIDKNGQVAKTLLVGDIRPVGAIPTPFHMEMRNESTGSRTIVDFLKVSYDSNLSDEEFTQRALERGL
ncbi:MAG: outer membrane lipoprotein-sorting protein [Candidatus Binatia bacterium]|nr:outer membrane lipoprotein-sorting protein [Candidatus Binatia bacterium]